MCAFGVLGLSCEAPDTQRDTKRAKWWRGEGKKRAKFWGPTLRRLFKIGLAKIGLAKIGFGQNWPGQNHDGQKWIGQNWIQSRSNQDGQNGIGQSRSLPLGLMTCPPASGCVWD